jgi:hypothetical protein
MVRRLVVLSIALAAIGSTAPELRARPLYGARTGMACARCHVDPSGGGMRTGTGFLYALNLHTMAPAEEREATLDPKISDGFRFGGDMRTMYTQDLQNELRNRSSLFLMQASLYLSATLSEHATLYYANDQGSTVEAFGLISGLPLDAVLKVGRFLPAYGIEEEDHSLFTRDSLGFGTFAEDTGVEITIARGTRSLTVATVNGTHGIFDDNPQKAIVAKALWYNDRLGYGLSGYTNTPNSSKRTLRFGAFGQFHQGPLVLLAEYDRGEDTPRVGPLVKSAFLMVDASLSVGERTTLRATFDRIDPNVDYAETARDRIGIGLDADLMPFTRLLLRARGTRQYGHDEYGVRDYGTDRDTYELLGQLAFAF